MGYLDEAGHRIVSDAVAEAELQTSGEIVTVLADRSDGYTDVILLWAIGIAFTAMSIGALIPGAIFDTIDGLMGGWSHEWTPGEMMAWTSGLGLAFFLVVWLIFSFDPVRFRVIPGPIKLSRVRDAAVRHFKVGADRRTHGRTGILIYVSMREHRAEIVADEAIATKVDAEVWGDAMADMLVEIRQGRLAEGLAAGVRDVGAVLSEHFPRAEDDRNELPDRLIEV
ncbi:TPM domain-containing protein [Qipengyuania sp.]|uniref:TPM domain-containing protein n=1 Tax=Qipengyuania sp. TaxID=2004515 RepID=UPI0035C878C8